MVGTEHKTKQITNSAPVSKGPAICQYLYDLQSSLSLGYSLGSNDITIIAGSEFNATLLARGLAETFYIIPQKDDLTLKIKLT